jgi:hypothetical protein
VTINRLRVVLVRGEAVVVPQPNDSGLWMAGGIKGDNDKWGSSLLIISNGRRKLMQACRCSVDVAGTIP